MFWHEYDPAVNAAEQAASRAENKVESLVAEIRQLQTRVDRLALACQGLWELLRENTDFTEEELEKKILEIDMRDGKTDGKIGTQIVQCPACGSNTNSRRPNCVMCGAALPQQYKFGV